MGYDSLHQFDYDHPPELIAQHPLADRSASRMLVVNRGNGSLQHSTFSRFPVLLDPKDVLVVNASRVIRARLHGVRENGREAEVLLVHPADPPGTWLAMVHPGGKLKLGRTITFGDAVAEVVDVVGGGLRQLRLRGADRWDELMARFGTVPLPPYITRPAESADASRYQTIFAREDGSVAAPTAGLHFSPATLDAIRARGIPIVELILHVGPGTFKPVQTERIADHRMHAEWFTISDETADAINACRHRGGRVWAVGTTVVRVLESLGLRTGGGPLTGWSGWTDIFIRPPFQFTVVDALLTNFHLPRSTLLMLVCAFGGYDTVMHAYREAVTARYRLFSYGDAMVIR